MKSITEYLTYNVPSRRGFVNITPEVRKIIQKSGIKEGLCLVNAMHITASVFINDDESGLHQDYEKWLEEIAPHEPTSQYQHNNTRDQIGSYNTETIPPPTIHPNYIPEPPYPTTHNPPDYISELLYIILL